MSWPDVSRDIDIHYNMDIDPRKQLNIDVLFGYRIHEVEESLSDFVEACGTISRVHLFGETEYHDVPGGLRLKDMKKFKSEGRSLMPVTAPDMPALQLDIRPPQTVTPVETQFGKSSAKALNKRVKETQKEIAKELGIDTSSTMKVRKKKVAKSEERMSRNDERRRKKVLGILTKIHKLFDENHGS